MAASGELTVSFRLHRARINKGKVEIGMEMQMGLKPTEMVWSQVDTKDIPPDQFVDVFNNSIRRRPADDNRPCCNECGQRVPNVFHLCSKAGVCAACHEKNDCEFGCDFEDEDE